MKVADKQMKTVEASFPVTIFKTLYIQVPKDANEDEEFELVAEAVAEATAAEDEKLEKMIPSNKEKK